jgi:uncharacterized protein YciI
MASSTASLQEWLVIVPDHTESLQKRLASRPKHLEGMKSDREDMWLWGGMSNPYFLSRGRGADGDTGAMLEEPIKEGETPQMKGSACLIGAKTKEEVMERMKQDVYVKDGVWDLEKVQIIPFKSAVRKAL